MDRDELHELIVQLKDSIASGEVTVLDPHLLAAIDAIRFSADGKVDPDTIKSEVKAAALADDAARTQREMRKIPLREVQTQYFEILEKFFGKPFSEMTVQRASPAQIAEHAASQDSIVSAFASDLDEFASGMYDFWNHYGPVVAAHLEDLKCLKSVFGGDIFPSYTANIACSVGLYMDTVILPDPLLRILNLAKVMAPRESCRLTVKHALSALGYKELALADVDPPIVVVAPDPMFLEPSYNVGLLVTSEGDLVKHSSIMFGRQFSDVEELQAFLSGYPSVEKLAAKLADPKRFLFDSEWPGSPPEQFTRYVREIKPQIQSTVVGASVAETTYRGFLGRMMQTNDLLFRSARYAGTPLIDAPTSWQYLLWKYEYDSKGEGTPRKEKEEVVISQAIASEGSTEFGMLSDLPPGALIELRRNGAMASLRQTIRTGLNEIDLASPNSLSKVAEEVVGTIGRTFEEHDKELRGIDSSRKFFGLDVSRWIVGGGLSVAAAALAHNVGLAVLAAATASVLGIPSVPDLRKRWQDLQSRSQELQRTPAAILFRHLGHKFGFSSGEKQ